MSRIWLETFSPKQVNEKLDCYHGDWLPQMDRCWDSDDGFQVTSRIIITSIGRVEHAAICRRGNKYMLQGDGRGDIPWAVKQEIKNELFGEDRVAIEVFPEESKLVDVTDTYHLWILPKGYKMPFGIHPKDTRCNVVNRGSNGNINQLIKNTETALSWRFENDDNNNQVSEEEKND